MAISDSSSVLGVGSTKFDPKTNQMFVNSKMIFVLNVSQHRSTSVILRELFYFFHKVKQLMILCHLGDLKRLECMGKASSKTLEHFPSSVFDIFQKQACHIVITMAMAMYRIYAYG